MSMLKLPLALKSLCNLKNNRLIVIPLLLFQVGAQAVPDSRLWLPSSYLVHMAKLKRAAATVEAEAEGCMKILRGGLQEDLSTQERPVFRIICRNDARKSYALLIDGIDMGVVDPKNPDIKLSFADLRQRREAQAEQARLRREQKRQLRFWELCRERLGQRTVNMRGLKWLTRDRPEPDILRPNGEGNASVEEPATVRYRVDFDAVDFKGKTLHYRGECTFSSEEDSSIIIRPRR